MKRAFLALTIGGALLLAGTAAYGGAHQSNQKSYAPTLDVSWGAAGLASSDTTPYVVWGCGYDSSLGGVTVVVHSPEAISFAGQMPADGCISLSNFSTQGAGHYQIDAYQTIHGKSRIVASDSFDL
jgi:hypothetical protein